MRPRSRTLTTPCIQIILAATAPILASRSCRRLPNSSVRLPISALTFPQTEPLAMQAPAEIEPARCALARGDRMTATLPIPQPTLFDQPEAEAMAKRILTIDDSKTIRDMLRMTLVDAGYDVLQAVDGQDGVEVLAARNRRSRHHRHQHAEDERLRGRSPPARQSGI